MEWQIIVKIFKIITDIFQITYSKYFNNIDRYSYIQEFHTQSTPRDNIPRAHCLSHLQIVVSKCLWRLQSLSWCVFVVSVSRTWRHLSEISWCFVLKSKNLIYLQLIISNQSPINLQSISNQSPANLHSISDQSIINLQSISSQSPVNLQSISSQSPANLQSTSSQS